MKFKVWSRFKDACTSQRLTSILHTRPRCGSGDLFYIGELNVCKDHIWGLVACDKDKRVIGFVCSDCDEADGIRNNVDCHVLKGRGGGS